MTYLREQLAALWAATKRIAAPRLATGLGAMRAQEARPQNLSENVEFDFGNAAADHSQRFGG
jgi:hypothetical protein